MDATTKDATLLKNYPFSFTHNGSPTNMTAHLYNLDSKMQSIEKDIKSCKLCKYQ